MEQEMDEGRKRTYCCNLCVTERRRDDSTFDSRISDFRAMYPARFVSRQFFRERSLRLCCYQGAAHQQN
jgi:hypothetical protein